MLSYNLDVGRDLTCTAVDEGPDLILDDEAEEGTVWNSARYPVEMGSPVPESHRCGEIDVSAPVSGIPLLFTDIGALWRIVAVLSFLDEGDLTSIRILRAPSQVRDVDLESLASAPINLVNQSFSRRLSMLEYKTVKGRITV